MPSFLNWERSPLLDFWLLIVFRNLRHPLLIEYDATPIIANPMAVHEAMVLGRMTVKGDINVIAVRTLDVFQSLCKVTLDRIFGIHLLHGLSGLDCQSFLLKVMSAFTPALMMESNGESDIAFHPSSGVRTADGSGTYVASSPSWA